MNTKKIAFIGAGRMAEALIAGIIGAGMPGGHILASDAARARTTYMRDTYGVIDAASNMDAALGGDVVILAVKPDAAGGVLDEIGPALRDKVLLSIVAGWTVTQLRARAPGARVVRVMPNTPALAGKGVFVVSNEHDLDEAWFEYVAGLLSGVGHVEIVEDKLMDAATALSGCGPAYVFIFAEALADAAVREGIPRDSALRMTAKLLEGAAAMLENGGRHPAALKDAVMSPGGATAEAVYALENNGFRGGVMEAVHAAALKSQSMHKE